MFTNFADMMSGRTRSVDSNKLRGVVVDNNDPKKLGRMKVRYRDIHDNISDEDLPWSGQHEGFGSGTKDVGKTDIPKVGTTVYGSHRDDSLYHPEWEHGPATDDKKLKDADNQDYPNTRVQNDAYGNQNKHETKDGKNTFTNTHQSGTQNVTDKDGNYQLNGAKNVQVSGAETVNIVGAKKVVIDSETAVEIRAPKVSINGSSPGKAAKTTARDKPQMGKTTGLTKY
jgi:hypothetical protein